MGRILGDLISKAEDESGTMIIESEVKSKDHFDVECSGNEADDEEDEENGFYTTNWANAIDDTMLILNATSTIIIA